ncbi:MAG TPA: YbaK/EbsC family protein, partial [Hyphomicrobiales bacterium]|nr:YbaK/EbsC family protein [Hyphomicrobiales bacterium]
LETTPVDLKTLHKTLESGRLSFGNADLLMELLGIRPGAVSAFCAINDTGRRVNVVFDRNLQDYDLINLHPLENTATTAIAYTDLVRFLEDCGHPPKIVTLTN